MFYSLELFFHLGRTNKEVCLPRLKTAQYVIVNKNQFCWTDGDKYMWLMTMSENIIKISHDHSQSLSNTYLNIFQGELTLLEKPMCKQNKAFFLDCFYLLSVPPGPHTSTQTDTQQSCAVAQSHGASPTEAASFYSRESFPSLTHSDMKCGGVQMKTNKFYLQRHVKCAGL